MIKDLNLVSVKYKYVIIFINLIQLLGDQIIFIRLTNIKVLS